MSERRGPWFLLTGLLIGLLAGLLYTWLINPVRFVDTAPDLLRTEFKDQYRSMVALAYQANQDLGRAEGRLAQLKETDSVSELTSQARRIRDAGGSEQEALALTNLAIALSDQSPASPTATISP